MKATASYYFCLFIYSFFFNYERQRDEYGVNVYILRYTKRDTPTERVYFSTGKINK